MNIDGKITLNVSTDKIIISIEDDSASINFAKVNLTPEQFIRIISGEGYVNCKIEINSTDKIGKRMEHKEFIFKMPNHGYNNQKKVAIKEVMKVTPNGWIPDTGFSSQNSFFEKDNVEYARCTIRRWV